MRPAKSAMPNKPIPASSSVCWTRRQADALEIEAQAKRRLADEYDAAQERGEVQSHGGQGKRDIPKENVASLAEIGMTTKVIHEARIIRDAEEQDPGIVHRTVEEALDAGEEPTRAKVRRAVRAKAKRATRRPNGYRNQVDETQHDRDLRALLDIWESACESARAEFLKAIQH